MRGSCAPSPSGSRRATARSTRPTSRTPRGSACACASAAPGASRPCAGPARPTPRRRSNVRWRSRRRSRLRPARPSPTSRPRSARTRARRSATPSRSPLDDKLAVLAEADAGLSGERGIALRIARFQALRVHKLFASTEGALCEQVLTECGGGLAAVAVDGEQTQVRSYPTSLGSHMEQAGYECFLALDLPGEAPRVAGRGGRAAARARLPRPHHDPDPRRRAARLADPRVDRSRRRARPRARARGLVRRHQLRRRGADRQPAVRLRARERDRGRDAPRRARLLPLGRRGRGGPQHADHPGVACSPASSARARRPPRSGSTAPAAACAPTASRASRSCA